MKTAKPFKGIQSVILKEMSDAAKPTELWTKFDILEVVGCNERQAENALYNLWIKGAIYKHNEPSEDKRVQYALKIASKDASIYAAPAEKRAYSSPKRKGAKATPKEIRMAFMQVQNSLAKLEDMIMPVVEDAEEKDKVLNKLKNML